MKMKLIKLDKTKQTWRVLGDIGNKRKSKTNLPSGCKYNESDLTEATQIAHKFCS